MKNLYKNKKLICTIISDTPYAKNKNGDLVGLGPTVEEIDQLSSLFCQIYHFAPLEKGNLHYHLINIIKIILPLYQ